MKILSKIKHQIPFIISGLIFVACLFATIPDAFAKFNPNDYKDNPPISREELERQLNPDIETPIDNTRVEQPPQEYSNKSSPDTCPLIDELRNKYAQSCWACPVLEQLVRSFIGAATVALSLSKEAGIFLLKFGTLLWILLWGLRHVSSMAQVEPANIIAELIKFLFKVMLAYAFILGGIKAIGTYFTNPIMGMGAKIAENFWEEERVKPNTKEYIWADISEESEAELEANIDKERQEYEQENGQQGGGQGGTSSDGDSTTTTQEGEQEGATTETPTEQTTEPKKDPYKGNVPPFLIPPVYKGSITSPAGCRKHPEYGTWKIHKGLDIGGNNGTDIVASADGKLSWKIDSNDPNAAKGYGCYATITHADGWTSVYAHMPKELCQPLPASSYVKKGDNIGIVGNSGTSTGPHLHFEVRKNNRAVEPLHLLVGEILYIEETCNAQTGKTPFPFGMYSGITVSEVQGEANSEQFVVVTPSNASNSSPGYGGSGSSSGSADYSGYTPTYSGGASSNYSSSVILSDSIIQSMIGATWAIGNITAENMILGEAVMCYAKQEKGGAWKVSKLTITNFFTFLEGLFIWVTGLLLTMAYAFYLVDIAFKIGFAVIALPIAVGLWPFELTKDKVGVCISIIAKAAATFAFLAITTTFTVHLSEAVYNYEENETAEEASESTKGPQGLAKLYMSFDNITGATTEDVSADVEYASEKLAIFSMTFVLLLFAFLYSFKLVRKTVPDLVNKFFPDKAFGDSSPMHHWATAVAQKAKDIAMVPVGYARDIAMYQGGKGVDKLTHGVGKGATKAVQGVGKGVQGVGKGLSAAGKGLQAVPIVGNVVGAVMIGAGKATEFAGKAVETTGKVAEKANDAVHKTANKIKKTASAASGKDKTKDK